MQAEFFIHTDHCSLVHLNEQRLHTAWQQKVFARLLGLQYKIIYKKGADNATADALSHRSHLDILHALSSVQHSWLAAVVDGYNSDPVAVTLLSQLAVQPDARPPFSLVQGVIRYKGRIWLGANKPVQSQILLALHASPIGCHSGAPVTYSRIKRLFFWPGMKVDVWTFVQSYEVCLQAKPAWLASAFARAFCFL